VAEPAVSPRNVARPFTGLEPHEQVATWAENPGGLREDARLTVIAPGHGDHAGRQVNPRHQTPPLGEIPAHPARAAPSVKNPPVATGGHRLSEGVDHGEV
jgi:hypothetical protein